MNDNAIAKLRRNRLAASDSVSLQRHLMLLARISAYFASETIQIILAYGVRAVKTVGTAGTSDQVSTADTNLTV